VRASFSERVERNRERTGRYATPAGANYGRGQFFCPLTRETLLVLWSGGDDEVRWEHVSVSARGRCPTWHEMHWVKTLFGDDEEAVMQLHPPKSQYVSQHPYCLHLWAPRPGEAAIPLPPSIAVGVIGGPPVVPAL